MVRNLLSVLLAHNLYLTSSPYGDQNYENAIQSLAAFKSIKLHTKDTLQNTWLPYKNPLGKFHDFVTSY